MSFTVYKLNHRGEEELHYQGELLERSPTQVCIRAKFGFDTRHLGYVTLKKGDIFTEWFYTDRWYNIFRVEDVDTGELKGFYCNFTRPAIIEDDFVKAEDLALDLFVKPNGETLLLDEDEFAALPLTETERHQVEEAHQHLETLIQVRKQPFDSLATESNPPHRDG